LVVVVVALLVLLMLLLLLLVLLLVLLALLLFLLVAAVVVVGIRFRTVLCFSRVGPGLYTLVSATNMASSLPVREEAQCTHARANARGVDTLSEACFPAQSPITHTHAGFQAPGACHIH
jgi:hypothetical protein